MALKWLHNLKNLTGRLDRWTLELLEFDYGVIYRKGSSQLYFFRQDLLKTSLLLDINPWRLVMPKKLRPQVLKENHDELQAGHLGSEKTHARISEYF